MEKIYIKDFLRENLKLEDYTFIKDFILLICIYLFYINFPQNIFTNILKVFVIIIIFRYILSLLTTYKENAESSLKYFQYNSQIAFIYILILTYVNYYKILEKETLTQFYIVYIFLILYILLNIGTKNVYTTDAISTIAITNFIYPYIY